jgi:hypothetical protein
MINRGPRVTVCVPARNAERYLREALTSITAQTYKDMRVVVSDNGSTDATPEIVSEFGALGVEYSRSQHVLSGGDNFNRCLELAHSEYVAVYHADDVYDQRIVARQVSFLDAHPEVGLVLAIDWWIDDRGQLSGLSEVPVELTAVARPLGLHDLLPLLLRESNTFLRTPTAMLRKAVIDDVGRWDTGRFPDAGDLDLWLRVADQSRIAILGERLASYRLHPLQWSQQAQARITTNMFFGVIDSYLAKPEHRQLVTDADVAVYEVRRSADMTTTAARLCAAGSADEAKRLLAAVYRGWRQGNVHPSAPHMLFALALWLSLMLGISHIIGRALVSQLTYARSRNLNRARRRASIVKTSAQGQP